MSQRRLPYPVHVSRVFRVLAPVRSAFPLNCSVRRCRYLSLSLQRLCAVSMRWHCGTSKPRVFEVRQLNLKTC
jgi:hypothetical protein